MAAQFRSESKSFFSLRPEALGTSVGCKRPTRRAVSGRAQMGRGRGEEVDFWALEAWRPKISMSLANGRAQG